MSNNPRGKGRGRGRGNFNKNIGQNLDKEKTRDPPVVKHSKDKEKTRDPPVKHSKGNENTSYSTVPGSLGFSEQFQDAGEKDASKDTSVIAPHSNTSVAGTCHNSKQNSMFAPHPGYGIAGRAIDLITNYFQLKCNLTKVYHYYINITSLDKRKENPRDVGYGSNIEKQQKSNISRKVRQEVFSQLLSKKFKNFEKFNPIYDGTTNIFTSSPLPVTKEEFEFTANFDRRQKRFGICLQRVEKGDGSNIIDMSFLKNRKQLNFEHITGDALLALNAIMNYRGPNSLEIRVGRSFFSVSQANRTSIGEGLEIWRGYIQTIHLTEEGPVMITNLSARLFHKAGPAIDYINEVFGRGRDIRKDKKLSDYDIEKISYALRGVRIQATHSKYQRKYYIADKNGVSKLPANETVMFLDGEKVSISEYYRRKYKPLKYPHLPCFQMRSSNSNIPNIPFENCEIVANQPRLRNRDEEDLPPRLASKMIRETAIPPVRRFQKIEEHMKAVQKECNLQMTNFNLSLSTVPKNFQGRVIDPPSINYLNSGTSSVTSRPNDCGTWRMEGRFIKALRVESWAILNFDRVCRDSDLYTFSGKLQSVAYRYGLILDKNPTIVPMSQLNTLDKAKTNKCQLVVIVLPSNDKHLYNEIKLKADCELGLVSQCMLSDAVFEPEARTLTNICLKMNVKLGGINHRLVSGPNFGLKIFFSQPVIVFGADVVHSLNFPSIASVVGSLDAYPSKYKVTCRMQENKNDEKKSQELILYLQSMVATILREFQKSTDKYPEKIIFYRDGVSEGQFKAVNQKEVLQIQKAAKEVFGFTIKLTFIIVQKRHQTRFKPRNPKDGAGREGNIPAGTVVDRFITYPDTFDYFLCSHEGIKGTSKPARYTILHDDNKFSSDELQSLTYHLCHTFARCNRSVSIPAPVKYADLAAYRAKKYADLDYAKWKRSRNRSRFYQMSSDVRNTIDNMDSFKNHMFFV